MHDVLKERAVDEMVGGEMKDRMLANGTKHLSMHVGQRNIFLGPCG